MARRKKEDLYEEVLDYDMDEDEYDGPTACDACGNDAWPKCMDACPLYDD